MDPDTGISPTSEHIVKDFDRVFHQSLPEMVKRRGLVDSGNQHAGKRYMRRETYSPNWGGARTRTLGYDDHRSTMIVHPRAEAGIKIKLENSTGEVMRTFQPPHEVVRENLNPPDEDELRELEWDVVDLTNEGGGDTTFSGEGGDTTYSVDASSH
mmetsp:Transcript_10480/g.15704  ORF Transcript_10480/g.15704 Transcript_10480/m.15704 type:complete len:155 (-) Transcript_10480:69-533(-)